ncbi:MAG: type III-B CRISPR module RAMP protein Cmr4 [Clostridia bacterium]|nr:type III-B CRISPR module RAMP protein Cmr4 [Clostridia bacterium]
MKTHLYKLTCITNMHVGSDSSNYSIVDNEVEKDDLLGCPTIHSSGVKGALRDMAEGLKPDLSENAINRIFGAPAEKNKIETPGAFAFVGAHMLTRPLRASGGNLTYINVTTPTVVNNFITLVNSFDCVPEGLKDLKPIDPIFHEKQFLCTIQDIKIEDEETAPLSIDPMQIELLKTLLGGDFALVQSFEDYPLPVVARNKLGENKNLWYEELVPHHTVFYLIIISPEKCDADIEVDKWLKDESIVQFGGNASIGCGYTLMKKWEGTNDEQKDR